MEISLVGAVEHRAVRHAVDRSGTPLERIALALNSTLELREVLRVLAEVTLDASGAARCSLFLTDHGLLRPAVAIGTHTDEDLWEAFREMGPIGLTPEREGLFDSTQAIVVEDALASQIVPSRWAERFALRSLVIVPLLAAGEPCGLLAVDYPQRRTFSDSELRMLEAIGASAGVAVRNARLYEATVHRARLQETLARTAAAMSHPIEPAEIAGRLAAAYTDLVESRCCAVGELDGRGARILPLLVSGQAAPGPIALVDVPPHIGARLSQDWRGSNPAMAEFGNEPFFRMLADCGENDAAWYLVIPLLGESGPRGAVLLGFADGQRLSEDERTAVQMLANIAGVAIERFRLLKRLQRQIRHRDVLFHLTTALTEHGDARALVVRLNELLAGHGVEAAGLAFRDRVMNRRLSGERVLSEERAAWRDGDGCIVLGGDILSVPMRLGRRVIGTLRIRPGDLDMDDRAFFVTLASGVAEVASRGALRGALEEAHLERAVVAERDRIAADLHDTVGQLFVAIGLLARREAERMPDDAPWRDRIVRLANLSDGGKWELEQAIRALAFVPAERRGLVPAMRALGSSFESDSGINILIETSGRIERLAPQLERALYRVANEALTNAWRHARCSFVRVEISFTADEVVLRIIDDGVGLGPRQRDSGPGIGVMSMRRAMAEVNGKLHVRNAARHGVKVEARVERRTER